MLRFRSLGSGSTGNAALVEATSGGRTSRLLLSTAASASAARQAAGQAGLAGRRHRRDLHHPRARRPHRLRPFAVAAQPHSRLDERRHLARHGGRDFEGRLNLARDDAEFAVGDIAVQPFTVPHDAREPLQLRCTDGARTLGVLTDLGHATAHVLASLAACMRCCSSSTTTATCWPTRPIRPS
jgi:hypothetical protein